MSDPQYKRQLTLFKNAAKSEMEKFAPKKMSTWKDEERAIANELARCSLFSCRSPKKARLHYSNHKLFSIGKAVVTYTGEELRAHDRKIWLAFAHAARGAKGHDILLELTSADICKLAGFHRGQHYYTEIYKSIQRLKATALTIFSPRLKKARAYEEARRRNASDEELATLYAELLKAEQAEEDDQPMEISGIMMSMIGAKVTFDAEGVDVIDDIPQGNLKWKIPLDYEMVALFAWPFLTLDKVEKIEQLPRLSAQILQSYYGSHQKPKNVLVSTLIKVLNLDEKARENKRIVLETLQELKDTGVLYDFCVEKGRGDVLVHVLRHAPRDDDEKKDWAEKLAKSTKTDPRRAKTDPQSAKTDPQTS